MKTGWKAPGKVRRLSESQRQGVRDKFHIIVEGSNLPAPVAAFEDMKLPRSILDALRAKGIQKPTPIQMQAHSLLLPKLISSLPITSQLVQLEAIRTDLRMPVSPSASSCYIHPLTFRRCLRDVAWGFLTQEHKPHGQCLIARNEAIQLERSQI